MDAVPTPAAAVAARFGALPAVAAVVLAGSRMSPFAGPDADLDLYVYAAEPIPATARRAIAGPSAIEVLIDASPWEPGDTWRVGTTGLMVDVMYRSPAWIEEQLDRVLLRHRASVGYSTCLWFNVLHSKPLFDRAGWFAALQRRADTPFPEELRQAIVGLNRPLLRDHPFSFLRQIEAAVALADAVAVQHRLTALLASFFDVLFALNRQPHPGEKRLLHWAEAACPIRPPRLAERIAAILAAAPPSDLLLPPVDDLLDGLDALVARQGLERSG